MSTKSIPAAEQRKRLKALKAARGNLAETARSLGYSRSTLSSWAFGDKGATDIIRGCESSTQAAVKDRGEIKLRSMDVTERSRAAEHRALKVADLKALQESKREADALQKRLQVVMQLEKARQGYQIPAYKPSGSQAIPCIVLSDLHMEETVEPHQVPGANNKFNLEIGVERLRNVFKHGQFLVDTQRHMAKMDTLCLAILGDCITGFIHEELVEANELSPIKATLHVMEQLSCGIEYLLKHGDYKKIIIPCCHGNHGRTTEKMRIQTSADNSYEWMMYQMLRKQWASEKRLEWHIADGYHQYVNLFDTTVRFHHGDAISYGGGIGGITIPIRKAIANWNTVQRADLDVMGHLHQFQDGGDHIVNGSLIGYNAFALKIKARFERPRQAFFLVDHKRGKTLTAEIFVE